MGRRFGGRAGDCPIAETVSDRLVRLPFYTDLNESEQEQVIEVTRSFRVTNRRRPDLLDIEQRWAA